jgi:flagellar M-ring protein FliF
VNYRRALEGELARTIGTLSEVSSARVHIALAKESLFVDQTEAAKASVVLRLKNNRPLAPATTRAIAGLVAGSVENLRPEAVVIVDTFGRPLTRPDENEDTVGRSAVERQQQIERDLSTRVVALLEPVVGAGRVRVNVSAQLQNSRIEQTEERFDPNTVVRSRQTSTETGNAATVAGGVAGARANQPPALTTSKPAAAASPSPANTNATPSPETTPAAAPANTSASILPPGVPGRATETTNYEVGRVTRHTISPQGDLARLSVAVIIDDERVTTKAGDGTTSVTTKAWAPDQLARFQNLVSAAVGLNAERGDILTVENVAFEAPVAEEIETAPGVGQQVMQVLREYGPAALRGLAVIGLAAFALFGVLRPMARSATAAVRAQPQIAAAAPTAAARLATVSEMEERIEAELDADDGERSRKLPVLTRRVAKLASDEPEQLARIVRGWMAEEDR